MAEYKVAQDVEAEDKLLGPFSFRQFVYLIVVAISIALAWGLAQIFIGLAIIPLPVILLFGALALPLRKDQPMEVYLAAVVSYHLKPRKRVWSPDGVESLIEITAPKEVEENLAKNLSQAETEKRLSYLANIADTGGWSIRHAAQPSPNSSMMPDQYYAAQQTVDVLDDTGSVAHSFDERIADANRMRREQLVQSMRQPTTLASQTHPSAVQTSVQGYTGPSSHPPAADNSFSQDFEPSSPGYSGGSGDFSDPSAPRYNPYPTIHQSVVQPLGAKPAHSGGPHHPANPHPQNSPTTSANPVSDDIISLANNSDLSVATIQREASRLKEEKKSKSGDGEVFVSLR